ncbi:hypothetical protein Hanom_Chr00s110513g01807501 [Helianthus anomalus]
MANKFVSPTRNLHTPTKTLSSVNQRQTLCHLVSSNYAHEDVQNEDAIIVIPHLLQLKQYY